MESDADDEQEDEDDEVPKPVLRRHGGARPRRISAGAPLRTQQYHTKAARGWVESSDTDVPSSEYDVVGVDGIEPDQPWTVTDENGVIMDGAATVETENTTIPTRKAPYQVRAKYADVQLSF